MVQILKLDTSRKRDARRYVQFLFDLYRDHPYWVPPLFSDAMKQVDPRRNPYFLHSEADFFLAQQGNEIVGRIAVLENRNYNDYHKKRDGFFYLFDVIDDQGAADALYGAAFDWCRSRGLTRIIGPKGFVVFEGIGMLLEGFEYLPAMGIPYNYAYYNRLTENVGFEKEVDFNSYYIHIPDFGLPERVSRLAGRVRERRGLRARNFQSKAELRAVVPQLLDAYNNVFTENWEYVPVTREEADVVADQMLQITRPEMVKVIVNKDDQVVGFLFAFINVGQALQRCRGRLFPLGWLYVLREMRRTKYLDVNGMGILEEYRGLGGNIIMYDEIYKTLGGGRGQFEHADMTQMADFVVRMLSDANTLGGEKYKVHRVYHRELV
jgi:GNAT superfamily N-acetyltransferase